MCQFNLPAGRLIIAYLKDDYNQKRISCSNIYDIEDPLNEIDLAERCETNSFHERLWTEQLRFFKVYL